MEMWRVDYGTTHVELANVDQDQLLNPTEYFHKKSDAYNALMNYLAETIDEELRQIDKARMSVEAMEKHVGAMKDKMEELRKEITRR